MKFSIIVKFDDNITIKKHRFEIRNKILSGIAYNIIKKLHDIEEQDKTIRNVRRKIK